MDHLLENDVRERDSLTTSEAAHILWEWRKYRNEVYWSSVYRWGAASLILTLIPYVLPDIIGKLGFAVLVFPVMAFLLSGFAAYLTAVQYRLYKQADHKFRSLIGKFRPDDIPNKRPIDRVFRLPLGLVIAIAFLFVAFVIETLSGLILSSLVRGG